MADGDKEKILWGGQEMFKMSFMKNWNTDAAINFITTTTKPIRFTYGLEYRNPTTYRVPMKKDDAITVIKARGLVDINEYDDFVLVNEFSSNDMW